MRYLRTYKLFESTQELTKEQIEWLDDCCGLGSWKFNDDGLVDVTRNFDCGTTGEGLMGIYFGTVSGHFDCNKRNLTSLEGCPEKVGLWFSCSYNQLTSLEGSPIEVGGSYNCDHNQLITLAGAPKKAGSYFSCNNNELTNLKGSPEEVGWDFFCSDNKLNSLEGCTRKVKGKFIFGEENPISEQTLLLISEEIKKGTSYPSILLSIKSKIIKKDWDALDKSSIDKLTSNQKVGYKLLGKIGG